MAFLRQADTFQQPSAFAGNDRIVIGLNDEEREAIREAGAEDARRSRVEHGLPERIEDPAAVAMLAAILRDIPAPRLQNESISDERDPAA